jgi:hypothetical protein
MRRLLLFAAFTATAAAQWTIQTPATTADLRGIDNVGNGTAWASGTAGTVLRTTDNGTTWLRCTTPPNADHLDFRGIQAFDANTAIVMSSGKGDLSRLYKTTDGCQTWKLIFTNPDKDGFWDAVKFDDKSFGRLLGDPVDGIFALFLTLDGGATWLHETMNATADINGESAFAASNSVMVVEGKHARAFCTGGAAGARIIHFETGITDVQMATQSHDRTGWNTTLYANQLAAPLYPTDSSGCFSLAQHEGTTVAVGGDYKQPDNHSFTAWTSALLPIRNQKFAWRQAVTPPHGYRSAVAYDAPTKTWITVGPNGTDISTDDGRNWHPLKPAPTDTPDADRNWNALSLPFVVGPHGRIGLLNPTALKPQLKTHHPKLKTRSENPPFLQPKPLSALSCTERPPS